MTPGMQKIADAEHIYSCGGLVLVKQKTFFSNDKYYADFLLILKSL